MTEGPKIDDSGKPEINGPGSEATADQERVTEAKDGPDQHEEPVQDQGAAVFADVPETTPAVPTSDDDEAPPQPAEGGVEANALSHRPWKDAAEPFVKRLSDHIQQRGRSSHTMSVPLGSARLLVTPKEQDLVQAAADGQQAECATDALIRDALGMRIMVLAHLRTLRKAEGADRNQAMYDVRKDVELGQELAFEMHGVISELSKEGDIEGAKELSEFRRRLLDVVERSMQVMGGNEEAFDLPEGAVGLKVGQHGKTVQDYDEKAAARARAAAQKTKEKKQLNISRKKKQMVALAVLSAILIVVLGYLWSHRERELNPFNVNDFKRIPGIVQVVNRAPGLIIIVDEPAWNRLNRDARETWARQVVDRAKGEGYRRVEFRGADSTGLALWTGGKTITIK